MPYVVHVPAVTVEQSSMEYLVYRCAPTDATPFHHWRFVPAATPRAELPDVRVARPVYVWSSTTGAYTPVNHIGVYTST